MEIKKVVDLDTLTQEEQEAIDSGLKTEEDLLADYEAVQEAQKAEWEEKVKKAEEIASNQKIRAEKAESQLKGMDKKDVVPPKTDNFLPQTDLIAILKADVAEEDIDEVVDYAKLKNISVAEALKSSVVRTILSEKKEERETANATAIGAGRRGSSKPNPSQLLADANKGILPESDEEMELLVKARKGIK